MSIMNLIQDSLNEKYALMRQQADAGTLNAQSNATASNAAAKVDLTRASLMPTESAANVAKTKADTSLVGETIKYLGPETLARIANIKANTGATNASASYTGTQDKVLQREGLMERLLAPGSLENILGTRAPRMPRGLGSY